MNRRELCFILGIGANAGNAVTYATGIAFVFRMVSKEMVERFVFFTDCACYVILAGDCVLVGCVSPICDSTYRVINGFHANRLGANRVFFDKVSFKISRPYYRFDVNRVYQVIRMSLYDFYEVFTRFRVSARISRVFSFVCIER